MIPAGARVAVHVFRDFLISLRATVTTITKLHSENTSKKGLKREVQGTPALRRGRGEALNPRAHTVHSPMGRGTNPWAGPGMPGKYPRLGSCLQQKPGLWEPWCSQEEQDGGHASVRLAAGSAARAADWLCA